MRDQTVLRRITMICFIAMLIMFIVHVQILVTFNQRKLTVQGKDSGSSAYMDIDAREGSTSSWQKRDYPLTEERTVDLTGRTIDGTLFNNSGDTILEWGLRINITGDCFINQAWTGEMEIHQFVGTEQETVQRLNLQDYRLDEVTLKYQYDGDLLIPLQPGDYLIYHPNQHNMEMPLNHGENVTIGLIFYYLDELDLSDYTLTLHFHRNFSQGWSFIVFIVLTSLCLLSAVMYGTSIYIFRNAKKQLEMRKSGLSGMSELYKVIYFINLPTGEITPVSAGDYLEELRMKYTSAKELLYTAVREDAAEAYVDAAVEFVNLDTLPERLKERSSIVYDFYGKHYGWCSIRFFAMDRTEDRGPENVIFTVQDINDERNEMQKIADRLAKAESVSLANSAFLSGASRDLQEPVRELLALDEEMMRETDPEKMQAQAKQIHGMAERMLLLINGMADRAGMETGETRPVEERYSLKQLVADTFAAVRPAAETRGIRLELETTETLPDALWGDAGRLKEVIVSLMSNAIHRNEQDSVRLSVFGKTTDETVHLLVSVRSASDHAAPSDRIPERKGEKIIPRLDLEIAGSLLSCMASGLKTVQSADAWQEVYFEIDQRIADPAPVGKIATEDINR